MKQKYSLCAVIMLMAMTFAMVPLRAQNTPPSCTVTLTMHDSYGDGWNGAQLEVYQYDTIVGVYTFDGGREAVQTLMLAADEVRLLWRRGQYDDECSFAFVDADDNVLFSREGGSMEYGETGDTLGLGTFVSNCPSCLKPTGLRLTSVAAGSLGVAWDQRDGVQWQTLCVPHGFDPSAAAASLQSANTLTVDNLQPNTAYDFYVRTVCSEGDTSRYAVRSFVTADLAEGCPYTMVLTDEYSNAFSGWKVLVCHASGVAMDTLRFPDMPADYRRYEQTISHSPQRLYLKVVPGNTNTWYGALSLTVVDANGDTVRMYTFDTFDLSAEYFDSIDYTCPTCIAPAPVAEALDSTRVRLSWSSTGAERYLVEYGTHNNDTVTRVMVMDTFLIIDDLFSGVIYDARVGGVCAGEDTSSFRRVVFSPARGIIHRIYVNQGKNDAVDGTSWATAFHSVDEAQLCADEQGRLYGNHPDIWVAEGTYYGNLQVYPSQHLYGGFVGDEPDNYDVSQRDWRTHHSVLDGSWNGACLTQAEPFTAATQTVFDGFIIGGGQVSNGTGGVSLKAHTVLRNCIIENSRSNGMTGHGLMSIEGDPDDVITAVENCTMQYGNSFGSVIYVENARIDNSLIFRNTTATAAVELSVGGALRHCDVVVNDLFDYGNTNAVKLSGSGATVVNSIVAQNALRNSNTGVTSYMTAGLVNTFDGVSYSALNGAVSGTGNISVDTLNAGSDAQQNYLNFVLPAEDDYRLNRGSAAIDAGTSLAGLSATDLGGNARVYGDAPDMGCFENDGTLFCLTPTNLAARVTEPGSVRLIWSEAMVDSYEVSYKTVDANDWMTVDNLSAADYVLGGLAEYTNYMVRVRAVCGGAPTGYSDTVMFNSGCRNPIESVTLGNYNYSYNSWSQVPVNMRYPYSGSYILVKASELGGESRTIDTIAFRYTSGSTENRYWRIAIAATSVDNLTTEALGAIDSGAVQEVFEGNYSFTGNGWMRMPLQQPYEYDGQSNLVIMVQDSTGSQSSYNRYFSVTEANVNTLYYYGYGTSNFYGPYSTTSRPDIYFNGGCDLSSCPRPRMSVAMVAEDTVSLLLSRIYGTPVLEISDDGGATYSALAGVEDTTTLYHITNLRGSYTYTLRLRCICGEGDTSQWARLEVTTAPMRYEHIYVKADATGMGNGSTWADAFNDINPAVEMARTTYQAYGYYPDIRVAAGIYYGDTSGAENAYFIQDPVDIYGGFAGNEPDTFDLALRDFTQNATILDGQRQRRVVKLNHFNNNWIEKTPVFDGFTLRGGMNSEGAGLYVDYQVLVNNCRIEHCYGGNNYYSYGAGIYFYSQGSTVRNTVIDSCTARQGAAIYSNGNRFYNCDIVNCGYPSQWNSNTAYNGTLYSINDTLVNCRIMHDTAYYSIFVGGPAVLENCLIYDNHTNNSSVCGNGAFSYVNCDVVMNTVSQNVGTTAIGGGVLVNSIVWGNRSLSGDGVQVSNVTAAYSAIEGGYDGEGNITLSSDNAGANITYFYPAFVAPEEGDFRLMGESACIDAALDSVARWNTDLAGATRVFGEHMDIGCYENHGEVFCVPPFGLTAQAGATAAFVEWGVPMSAESVSLEYRIADSDQWTVVENPTGNSIMLDNLLPQTAYQVRMKSLCAGGETSGYSAVTAFTTECSTGSGVVAVGDTAARSITSSSMPNYMRYSYYSFSQQLFMQEELGSGGIIDTLRFQLASGYDANRHLKIYMGTTSKNSYTSGNDVILLDGQELVFDTMVNFTGENGWLTIALQNAYDYSGNGNLVLSVVDSSPANYYYSSPSYYVSSSNFNRSLYTNSYSPITIDNNNYFSTSGSRNVMLFSKTCGNEGCARPLLSVSDVSDSSATVVCQTGEGVELQYKALGDYEYTSLPLQQSQTITGLHQNTTYVVRTRSTCAEDDTSRWRMVRFTTPPKAQNRYYVAAQGTGNGTSWSDAAGSIEWALNTAAASRAFYHQPVDIWVAEGTYLGSLTVVEGINVYGGFAGNEPDTFDLAQRDFVQHASVIDAEGAQRVLTQPDLDFATATLWDGFTLRNGNVLNASNANGGGVYMRRGLRINHFTIEDCRAQTGGGIYAYAGSVVENTVVKRCESSYEGGGIYAQYSRLENVEASFCKITYSSGGAGIYTESDTVINSRFICDSAYMSAVVARNSYFENCLVWNNIATTSGAISTYRSTFVGCDIVENTLTGSGSVAGLMRNGTYNNYNTVVNTIVWGNKSLGNASAVQSDVDSMRYCAVEGGYAGTGNIALASDNDGSDPSERYPLFASPDEGDFRLMPESPCIDAGDDTEVSRSNKDANGNPRRFGAHIDIGCFENDGTQICVFPSNLAAQTSTDAALVSWTRPRGAISSRLEYRADSTDLWTVADNLAGNSYMIEGLQPQSLYHYRMSTSCDEEAASNYSPVKNFMTECSEGSSIVVVGDSASRSNDLSYLPLENYYNYSLSQQIFLSSEIGDGGLIDTIRFQQRTGSTDNRKVKIYMGHTAKNAFGGSSDIILSDQMQLVYDGLLNLAMPSDGWLIVPLLQAFDYNGADNLVLTVLDSTGTYSSYAYFYTAQTPDNKVLYLYRDGSKISISATESYNVSNQRNIVSFSKHCGNTGCPRPLLAVLDVTDSSAVINCQVSAGLSVELQYRAADSTTFTPLPPLQRQVLQPLRQNTTYTVRTRSVCAPGDTSAWRSVTFTTPPKHLSRYYVALQGTGDGSSWNEASPDLGWVLATAEINYNLYHNPVEVWVASGTWFGGFVIKEGVNVFGGFAGNEPADYDIRQRDLSAHATILDGQNSQTVLTQLSDFTFDTAIWDGFTIRNGRTSGSGGGLLVHGGLSINNFKITDCLASSGGGIYAYGNNSDVKISNTIVTGDSATSSGGGIYAYRATLQNVLVSNNGSRSSGGGLYISGSCVVTNVTVVNNYANTTSTNVAGIYNGSTYSNYIYNSIVWGNRNADGPDQMAVSDNVYNTAVEGMSFSASRGNIPLAGSNTGAYAPMFVMPTEGVGATYTGGNWHLQSGAISVGRGNNDYVNTLTDLQGDPRVQHGRVDLGCYETSFDSIPMPQYGNIVYVKPSAVGAGDGSSWNNAIDDINLAQMIAASRGIRFVWVAEGLYYGNPEAANGVFSIVPSVSVYGGFEGTEPENHELAQRDFENHTSILDGGGTRRVLYQSDNINNSAQYVEWNGFTLRNGNVLNNSNSKYGGGAYLRYGARLVNCVLTSNTAQNGGGVYLSGSYTTVNVNGRQYRNFSTRLLNCKIINNTASSNGGGVYLNSNSLISNSLIAGNTANNYAGGVYNTSGYVVNATIVGNTSQNYSSGGYYCSNSSGRLDNSIVWNNKKGYYVGNVGGTNGKYGLNAIEGGIVDSIMIINLESSNDGTDINKFYPRFSDPQHGDYSLHVSSPAINYGDSLMAYYLPETDLTGNPRFVGLTVDLGAYETHVNTSCPSVVGLAATNVTSSSATISWMPMGEENTWSVRLLQEESGTDSTFNATDTLVVLDGLQLNRTYTVYVRALCDTGGVSLYSIPLAFTTQCDESQLTPLDEFTSMLPADNTVSYTTTLDFAWTSMPMATSYDFYFWKAGESEPTTPTRRGLTTAGVSDFPIPNYANNHGSVFYWKVVAWNECISRTSPVMTLQEAYLPNLHVSGFTLPDRIAANQTVTISWTVVNDGQGSTPPGATWNDYIWVTGHNGVGGGFLYNVDEQLLATVPNLRSLAPGESYTNSVEVQLPQDYIGGYYFFVFADQYSANNIDYSPTGDTVIVLPYTPSATGTPYPYLQSQNTSYPSWYIYSQMLESVETDNFFYIQKTILPPPTPNLHVTSTTHPLNAYSGDTVVIQWQVTNEGDAAALGSWTDAVYLSASEELDFSTALLMGTYYHDGTLNIGASYTGTISGELPIEFNGTYYVFISTDIQDALYESIYEADNTESSNQTMNVIMSPPADLEVTAITMDGAHLSAGSSYMVNYSVKNVGARAISASHWRDVAYLSASNTFDRQTARQIGSRYNYGRSLGIEESYSDSISITIPDSINDIRYLYIVTDADDHVFEYTYEDNNVLRMETPLHIYSPDLQTVWVSTPQMVVSNQPVTLVWRVVNTGQGKVSNRRVRNGLTSYGQNLVTHNDVLNIATGEYIEYTDSLVLPCRASDEVTLYAKADMNNTLYETDENNSTGVALSVANPDLSVSNLTLPDTLWSGTTVTASWILTNSGLADVDATVTDRFYLGDATAYNSPDSMCNISRRVTLPAGQSIVETFEITVPNGVQGQLYVHQIVNADGDVCEGVNAVSNHAISAQREVMLSPYPDLVVTEVEIPLALNIGEAFTLNYSISNQGTGDLNGKTITTQFYISRYNVFSKSTATLIGDDSRLMRMAVGLQNDYSASVRVPTTLTSGSYYVYAVVDATDVVYEYVYENNNTTRSQQTQISIYPLDMAVTSVNGVNVLDWGGTYTVSMTVANLSQVPSLASYWDNRLFLSQDEVLQATDLQIGNVLRREELQKDSSYTVNFSFKMPYGYTSPAYLIALTDPEGRNPDVNTANNILVQAVTVNSVPTADLAVTNAEVVDEQVFSGQLARIAYTITNISEQSIDGATWTDKVFLSSNNTFDATDVEVGTSTKYNMSLAAGASYTDTAIFRVPLPQNGTVYLIVRANNAGSFYESNTANNTASAECNVTLPQPGDLVVDDIVFSGNVVSGDTLQLSWKVKNVGSNALIGNGLRSLTYLSTNTSFDANDRLLGSVGSDNVNIIPGGEMDQQLAARIAGIPEGDYYVIVKTDVSNMFNEVDDENNTSCSAYPFTLTVRELPFNTPLADVLYNNLANDYKVVVDTNIDETVRIHLQSEDETSGAVNTLYVSHNNIGSSLGYDFASIDHLTHNPEIYIPATEEGYYGINLQGSTPTAASQEVVIRADILPFELRDVTPRQGGNTGRVTVMLTGSRFSADMQVLLNNAQGETIRPEKIKYDSYYKAFATFDLSGKTVGTYSVSVVKSGEETSTLQDAFRIVAGTPENLYTNLIFPQSPRPNRTVVAMLEYGNVGNTDITDPAVVISSIASTPISLTADGLALDNTTIRVPLQIAGDVDGLLRPGTAGFTNVYVSTVDNLTFTITRVEDATQTYGYTPDFVPSAPLSEITAVVEQAEGCVIGNDGVVSVRLPEDVSATDYLFRWTTAAGMPVGTTQTVTGLATGGYRVRMLSVADTNIVAYEDYVYVDKIDTCNRLRVLINSTCHTDVCSTPSVESFVTAVGGIAPYTYSWANRIHTVTGSGRYTISCRVVDAEGRVAYGTQEIYLKGLQCSQDPNEIKGPEGYNEDLRFVAATDKMNYTIGFENDPDFATAPATRVSITYPVPEGQNIASFRLSDFGFGNHLFSVPDGSTTFSKRLDVSDDLGVWVDVTAGIDVINNQLFWIFQSIDPATGFEPASSQMGFLPVNDSLGRGEGYVSFLIAPKTGRSTGDTVVVDATIVFDDNAPIATNKWKNTFDAVPPTSSLHASLSPSDSNYCIFTFSAADDHGGSGVDHVELFVSQNEGSYEYFASAHPDSSLRFALADGILYRFSSVAVDHVGNREELKIVPDTMINNNTAPTDILLTASSFRENAQPATVIGRLATIDNDITLPFSYELVEGDGDNDNALFAIADGRLVTDGLYNCDGRSQYAVRVRTTDITGLSFEKSFVLSKIQENFPVYTPLSGAICAGDSYSFGSRSLTVQDSYVDSLHTVMGCDSIVTLDLRVNPVYHLADYQVVCDSLTWQNGITYTASTSAPTRELLTTAGCDSVITLNLTVNYSNTGDTSVAVCDSYEWHGTTYTASTETPTFTTTNAAGCDSTTTLHLTVNYSTTGSETMTACDEFEWHGTTYTASAEPTYLATNAAGCDSTTTLHLTVNYSTTGDTVATACDLFAWQGLTYTVSTDTATRLATNAAGCDSTTTLHLTVNYSNTGSETMTACDSYEWHGTTYTASTETPTFTTTNAAGCDSTTTLHLTVNYSSTGDTAAVACDEFEWRGTLYTTSGTPTFTATNAAGCDSTVTLSLTINYSTDVTLEETATNSFVWHGDTLTESGTYTYNGITEAGCDSTVTLVLTIEYVGIGDVAGTNVRLYPNPTRGVVTIEADAVVEVEVYDLVGRKVAVYENTNRVDFTPFDAGTYTLRIRHAGGTTLKRVVRTR